MTCEEIMKKDVECVAADDTVQSAAQRMRDENVGFLPVCDANMKVLGTVTDRDLAMRVLAEGRAADANIRDIYSRQVISCSPSDDIGKAEALMTEHQKSRIVCVDAGGVLKGIISLSDLARKDSGQSAWDTLRGVTAREARA